MWTVYAIAPDGCDNQPFYIGITEDVHRRAAQHNTPDSAAYDRSKALEAVGIDCTLSPLAHYETEAEARAYETAMIALHAGLVNRTQAICMRAMQAVWTQQNAQSSASESNNLTKTDAEWLEETVNADG